MALEAILRGVINIEDVELRGGQALYGNIEDAGHRQRCALGSEHGGRDSYQRMLSTFQTVADSVECGLQDRAITNPRPSYLAGANARIQQVLARPSLEAGAKEQLAWPSSKPSLASPGTPGYKKQMAVGSRQSCYPGSSLQLTDSSKPVAAATVAGAAAATAAAAAAELQPQELLSQAAALHQHLDSMGCNRFRPQRHHHHLQQQQSQQQADGRLGKLFPGQGQVQQPNSSSSSSSSTGLPAVEHGCSSPCPAQQSCYPPNSSLTQLNMSYSSAYNTSMSVSCCSNSFGTPQSCSSSMGSSTGVCPEGVAWILPQVANTQVLSAYEFGRQLGVGTFGVTRLVRDRRSAAPAACKSICKQRVCANPTLITDIQREVQIQQHLTGHPNVVGLRGVYEDTRNVHLVLDLCTGGDLHDYITRCPGNRLSEREAAIVTWSMLEALAFCHARGVIHRDVKPENFLLETPGSVAGGVKVSDFGVSAFYTPGQRLAELVGTPYYMAPEVIQRAYGPEADVWSVGVVLYLMLSGRLPFLGSTDRQVVASVLYKEPDFSSPVWQQVSEPALALVRGMLVKDPKQRATISSLLARPWLRQGALQRTSSSSSTPGSPSRCSSLSREAVGLSGSRLAVPGALVVSISSRSGSGGSWSPTWAGSGRLPSLANEAALLRPSRSGSSSSSCETAAVAAAAAAGDLGGTPSSPREAAARSRPSSPRTCGSRPNSSSRASIAPQQQQQQQQS